MSLRADLFYIFRLSRRRFPYSEFCLLNSVFLSALFTAEPITSDLVPMTRFSTLNKRLANGTVVRRIKDDVDIADEMIEYNRKNPDLVSECIRIGGGELVTT